MKQNAIETGFTNAAAASWIPPTATFASPPSSPVTGSVYVFTDALSPGAIVGGGTALSTCRWSGSVWVSAGGGGGGAHGFGAAFDGAGSALVSGMTAYLTVPVGGTITAWNIVLDTGTCTFKVWKITRGTAKPTSANSINTSGVSISTGTAVRSTTLTDFTTTTVADGDIVGINLFAVASAIQINFTVEMI